ncbi:condensin complex subunit 2-like [Lutzomyia longipalpis]|uniref:condensin complex subunit 2-like n=1 Tax=Lutzomyia longipalpis TaxID=7200 RepID=UPI0024841352|nr:condensin complex subunit 2-like [Lutzomyia longipalpis]
MENQSPLRRSNVGVFKTPALPEINDDEAERENTRRSFISNASTASSSVDQCESLQMGLKLFQENKFTKENAWNIPLIDSFTSLIRKHHMAVGNLQMAGYGLEASTKLWAIRVDSTHEKSMRLLSGLGNKKASRLEGAENDNLSETMAGQEESGVQQPRATRRKKRPKSMIARNVETINAKLETVPLPDPITASLRSVLGSIANPKNLLCNRLSDRNGVFNLDSNAPFNYPDVRVNVHEKSDWSDSKMFTIAVEDIGPEDRIRPMMTHYEIKDTPADEDEEIPWEASQLGGNGNGNMSLAFDMDAEVEPLPELLDDFMPMSEPIEQDFPDVGEITEEDRAVILASKVVRPNPIRIHDLRPTEANHSRLEYSYRPLEMINQYWAGPSHWKFKKTPKMSLVGAEGRQSTAAVGRQRRGGRATQRFEAFVDPDEEIFFNTKDTKLRQMNSRKKWEQKEKLKLPTDFKFDRAMFNKYKFAQGVMVMDANSDAAQAMLPIGDDYNYDNPVDRSYCSNVIQEDTDTETGTDAGGGEDAGAVGGDNAMEAAADGDGMEVENATIGHFGMEYENAPEKVEKIVLPYSKRPKFVDMKQLKKACWHLISVGCGKTGTISFMKLYRALPAQLSPMMRKNLSMALAFYAILHLANEHGLELIQRTDLKDFGIKLPESTAPAPHTPPE